MKTKLLQLWSRWRSSYWFVPTLMAASAVALALLTVQLDRYGVLAGVHGEVLVAPDTASARAFLTTVAGSMITVAGVVFSITMVALTLASSQFGSRLLESFMRDRGNQVVLGTFIATFLYCLLVLRVLGLEGAEGLPELSLATAFLLTLGSLAVLIYFIHHAAVSIQVATLAAEVARDLERAIGRLLEEGHTPAEPGADERELAERVERHGLPVAAEESAYVDSFDGGSLLGAARDHDLLVVCAVKPGRFVVAGSPLLRALPRGGGDGLDPEVEKRLRGGVLLASQRRPEGDVEFGVEQLVDLAVRALSPGINDPFTAVTCVDLLAASLARVAESPPPSPHRCDDEGRLRVVMPVIRLGELLDVAYHPIRQNARGVMPVTLRLLERLCDLAERAKPGQDLDAVLRHAAMVARTAEAVPEPEDREDVDRRYQRVVAAARRAEKETPAAEAAGAGG